MQAKTNKLAMAVLALSLTQVVNASENTLKDEVENKSTYWGIGIGSVLGAVIAGPPGAALGATLGGSIGWGKDQNDALDESLNELEQQELAFQQNTQILEKNTQTLEKSEQEILKLRQSNAKQASRLNDLETQKESKTQDADFLKSLVAHYTQDIYFRSGQSEAPDYAQARLASLVELLKNHPNLRVTLKGYTDPLGSAKLNAKLAQARVDGIKELLKTHGVDESRITGLAIGEVEQAIKQPSSKALQNGLEENLHSILHSIEVVSDTANASIDEIITADASITKPKTKDHVLDRRVSIELSVNSLPDDQSLASLAVLKQ
jgi:outer membrane protein OmpA-like peptidoglycan-associated protein